MTRYFRKGFTMALQQPFAVIMMFLYQAVWGMILYKLVQSVLVPLMHRYPDANQPRAAMELFLMEGQFQLLKTDLLHSYVSWLVILLIIRMLFTPLLNAGIYYSLTHDQLHAGYRFFKGIRELALPYLLYYILQLAATMLPVIWLFPKIQSLWSTHGSYPSALTAILPWLIGIACYSYGVRLLFMYIQFARASRVPLLTSLPIFLRYSWLIVFTALLMLLLSGLLAGTMITATYIWAGFAALLIYQLYPLLKIFMQIWNIAAQFQLYAEKENLPH
ncbi:hypothetical protein [Paenibacillus eucommiae]|uniref:DUF4013 domain-containing protein n=1 Tax=Paenibacillus eucommiae TaxID=1355755 RepID=A0ABS4J534_9BACL|nr:hypothetical protein [Paenibacillus eucommiae]MBP1994956.1 hypothetical protein [Paenibacillus eucommiae]